VFRMAHAVFARVGETVPMASTAASGIPTVHGPAHRGPVPVGPTHRAPTTRGVLRQALVHEPDVYPCPFCALAAGSLTGTPRQSDIVRESKRAIAFISPRWWPNNRGHVIVIPRTHVENVYAIGKRDAHAVADLVREVAIGIRATYGCDGVSTVQLNEPAGGQEVWHLHEHVVPRYVGDRPTGADPLAHPASLAERKIFAARLRAYWLVPQYSLTTGN
jgi:histidine triad (HIT) family protein